MIELKKLKNYITYDLLCEEVKEEGTNIVVMTLDYFFGNHEYLETYVALNGYTSIKPLLRPLSDLEEEGNKYIKEIEDICRGNIYWDGWDDLIRYGIDSWAHFPFQLYEYLFENHFDLYNLIKEGSAIDINTLNK